MIEIFRYTGINLGGWIEGVVMNEGNHFMCLQKKTCFKDNVKTAHWVGNSKLWSIDTDYLFKRTPVVDVKQASVTENTMKQSVSRK